MNSDIDETALPLVDLSGIHRADALRTDWPRADAIIGNPPYHGTQSCARARRRLRRVAQARVRVGVKDYAVYWFRKAHDHLELGGRAGLVATNSISAEPAAARASSTSRQRRCDHDAVSNQDWPGEADVDVSIVNWVKAPAAVTRHILDGVDVAGITPTLRPGVDPGLGAALPANSGRQFFGVVPGGEDSSFHRTKLTRCCRAVAPPTKRSSDLSSWGRHHQLTDPAPSRFIIDFHFNALEEATQYPLALQIVRALVKPDRDTAKRRRIERSGGVLKSRLSRCARPSAVGALHRMPGSSEALLHDLVRAKLVRKQP